MEDNNLEAYAPNVFKLISGQLESAIQERMRASGFVSKRQAQTSQNFFNPDESDSVSR